VRDDANYLLTSSSATEDEQRLANEAIEWRRGKRDTPRDEAKPEEPKPAPVRQKRKGKA